MSATQRRPLRFDVLISTPQQPSRLGGDRQSTRRTSPWSAPTLRPPTSSSTIWRRSQRIPGRARKSSKTARHRPALLFLGDSFCTMPTRLPVARPWGGYCLSSGFVFCFLYFFFFWWPGSELTRKFSSSGAQNNLHSPPVFWLLRSIVSPSDIVDIARQ